jgi:Protein of unknown function (DUF3309)
MVGFGLMILLSLLLVAVGPWWPFSRGWGYTPLAGLVGMLLVWMLVVWLGWVAFIWPWQGLPPPAAVPVPAG